MAERKVIDFTNEKKVSVIKNQARQAVLNDLYDFLKERYERVGKVESNQVALVVGVAKDDDGYSQDVVVVLNATTKLSLMQLLNLGMTERLTLRELNWKDQFLVIFLTKKSKSMNWITKLRAHQRSKK